MKRKVMLFNPGDEANIKLHFKCNKLSMLKVELIELDNCYLEPINEFEL